MGLGLGGRGSRCAVRVRVQAPRSIATSICTGGLPSSLSTRPRCHAQLGATTSTTSPTSGGLPLEGPGLPLGPGLPRGPCPVEGGRAGGAAAGGGYDCGCQATERAAERASGWG
eukprot:scaffold49035_cov48-Phaeocystis_antarctica.AAC.1